MDVPFKLLVDRLLERLQLPLPGGDAHEEFRAHPVGSVRPLFNHANPPRPGGVLILLFEERGQIKFPLIRRPDYLGAHGGQVSLPGGKTEENEDVVETALRECYEEIGVPSPDLRVLGKLSDFFVMPSNFMVTPVIAVSETRPEYKPNPAEVQRVLEMDMDAILRDDAIKQKEILAAGKYRMLAPHFEVSGEIVWGATAMMLNEFRIILKEIVGK